MQTVYLALVLVFSLLMLLPSLPAFSAVWITEGSKSLLEYHFTGFTAPGGMSAASGPEMLFPRFAFQISGVLSLLIIFMFRNLALQSRLSLLNIALIIAGIAHFVYDARNASFFDLDFHVGSFFPFLMLISAFLALRNIRRDIDLLASADRLR